MIGTGVIRGAQDGLERLLTFDCLHDRRVRQEAERVDFGALEEGLPMPFGQLAPPLGPSLEDALPRSLPGYREGVLEPNLLAQCGTNVGRGQECKLGDLRSLEELIGVLAAKRAPTLRPSPQDRLGRESRKLAIRRGWSPLAGRDAQKVRNRTFVAQVLAARTSALQA